MATIYRIHEHDYMTRFYFYATKAEAEKHVREYDGADGFDLEHGAMCELEAIEVKPTRAGIAAALNDLMDLTCFNEG